MAETKAMEPRQEPAASESEGQESPATIVDEREPAAPRPLDAGLRPPRRRLLPFVATLIAVAIAVLLGRAMWNAYMGAPWTRDGTVRASVATMAPEVSGRIVELPVADNQFVHKGDMLMVIDPTNYRIAVASPKRRRTRRRPASRPSTRK
jgi:multidrug resistance efflux pump